MPRTLISGLVAAVVVAAVVPVAASAPDVGRIAAGLPAVADFPRAGLAPQSGRVTAVGAERAPEPCAGGPGAGLRATPSWGEWAANGSGRSVRVAVFAYPASGVRPAWRALRRAIAACPRTRRVQEDDGSYGTATLDVRRLAGRAVHVEVLTRSAAGRADWSRDRVLVYQRAGDAIQRVEVSRRVVTAGDRAFASQVARLARDRYLAAVDGAPPPAATAPVPAEMDAPIASAIAALPPGAKLNVAIGDSMASGEGGRWRGNVFWQVNWATADAYGDRAYWDTPTGESIPGCHRAMGAEINIPGTSALNLACGGATTTSMRSTSLLQYGQYKPGIDDGMVDPATGTRMPGQLTLLGRAASQAPIGTVVMSIGGNDMGFADVMTSCIAAFMHPWPFEQYCLDDPDVRRRLSDDSLAVIGQKVEQAIVRTVATMRASGHADGSWQMLVQDYPRLVAEDSRYPDTYAGRLYAGGCPIHSADVAWLNDRVPMARVIGAAVRRASAATGQPVRFVDVAPIFAGRELCARGTEHVDQMPAGDVAARAERVQMVRALPPFQPTEGLHPNQIGQQALQACLREAISGGAARSGRCDAPADWARVDDTGLPLVRFTPN